MLVLVACDKAEPPTAKSEPQAPSAAPAPAPPPPATPDAAAASAEDAGGDAHAAAAPSGPERPIPRPANTVTLSMPPETQMKAIAYMAAMRAPRPDDANADLPYAEELAKKMAAGAKGAEVLGAGRQIDVHLVSGCDDQAPAKAVARTGSPLSTLLARGVLVVRCDDAAHQCLQSTRDKADVLCTSAPRGPRKH